MFGLAGRRTVLAQSKCLTPRALPARAVAVAQSPCTNTREFRTTPTNEASRPTWMPMRVKTPWIEALTQSREAARESREGVPPPTPVKPELTPKKMSDSYYSAVCMKPKGDYSKCVANYIRRRFCLWPKINGFWIPISMPRGISGRIKFLDYSREPSLTAD